ncbi:hypothetical protein GALL_542600 [mine drainage metagenome]|uniref:Uncharacterized protein n=1 Tax=mine drainage metagenome TaxID=410659 RepID=A0A1J5NZD8_9ZZZZ
MGVLVAVDVGSLVQGALDAHLLDAWNLETISYPTGEVFVGRLLETIVQQLVVERRDALLQAVLQLADFATRKARPSRRDLYPDFGQETVAVEAARPMAFRK